MNFRTFYISLLITVFLGPGFSKLSAQGGAERKRMEAVRTVTPPVIDGILDEAVWQQANIAGDFVQYSPYGGKKASFKTEVRLLYDDEAIYIAATMYDSSPDSILRDLGKRDTDMNLNADFFYVDISTFNDGLNGETFKISASGVQSDMKARSAVSSMMWEMGDRNWDAVWFSSVRITDIGWVAEIKIPFSALRFSSNASQTWGVNFWREIRRYREVSSWNYVDREAGSTFNHLGEISGLADITPPVRLSLTPYLSGYMERFNGNKPDFTASGGLDIKYGISESFTLDATLIPDFGQVQSDDHVLNLTPYEVKYNERRPFFMEGTELFSRGDLFYSRRIGATPKYRGAVADSLNDHEVVIHNPHESSLMNATKISGRTRSGLGIGFFNAFTKPMFATLEDTLGMGERRVESSPLTNYNMVVLDQTLRNGSFMSLMNTNMWSPWDKSTDSYTANVSGAEFKLQNSSKVWSIAARGTLSQKYYSEQDNSFGHSYNVTAGKTGGKFRSSYSLSALSDTYDPNDMGYLRRNNEFNNSVDISYNTFKPFWLIYTTRNSITLNYNQLYNPRVFTGSSVNLNSMTMFKNHWSLSIRSHYTPGGEDDYYETRAVGRFYHRPRELMGLVSFDTDKSKKYYLNFSTSLTRGYSDLDPFAFSLSAGPEIKLSSRATAGLNLTYDQKMNDAGYVATNYNSGDIYFGKRDNSTISTTVNWSYIFTADIALTFRMRHYWSRVDYTGDFYLLNENGTLTSTDYSNNHDYNYNAFNIDMAYTWRFAPGSELSVVWKHAIYADSDLIYHDLGKNLDHMFSSDKMNSISLKVLYYLDYQNLKKRF